MSNTFIDDLLPDLDDIRTIAGDLGLRPWTASVKVRTYAGDQPGQSAWTDGFTLMVNQRQDGTSVAVKVRQVSRADIIASGGVYSDRDVRVGPMTPPYPVGMFNNAGGFGDVNIDPSIHPNDAAQEIFWRVSGPGWPVGGGDAMKIGEEFTAMHAFVILRATGRQP